LVLISLRLRHRPPHTGAENNIDGGDDEKR